MYVFHMCIYTCIHTYVTICTHTHIRAHTGVWFKMALVYGSTDQNGRRGILVMHGSQYAFQFLDEIAWGDSPDDFIQAIQLPGGVLMSPIHVTLKPLSVKSLQERYYHQKPAVLLRRGPAVPFRFGLV